MTLTAWAVTTGEAGMRTQARGLAAAVADVVVEKVVGDRLAWPWAGRSAAVVLAPPWPDIMITCGRRAAPHAIAVKRASGGKTLIVHVQDPRARRGAFDLIVAMDHDRIDAGGNVIKVPTALHDLTAENLAAAGRDWRDRFAYLVRPLIGVAIGGDIRGRAFSSEDGERLVAGLLRLRTVAGVAITPSRRTPAALRQSLNAAFLRDPAVFLWDLEGDNPYRAILALSDRLVVTGDSVSMMSEAVSTPLPVEVMDLGIARYAPFIEGLIDAGRVSRFGEVPTPAPTATPINATEIAAKAVRALFQSRTGVVG